MKYIYHHLGLGDHIICNGLVRHFCELLGNVTVFCKHSNYKNVHRMFSDNESIIVLPLKDDVEVVRYINEKNLNSDTIKIGFENLWSKKSKTFDIGFYESVDVPFEFRFSKFKLVRNLIDEKKIYEELNPNDEDYIFLHEDPVRGFFLDRKKIKSGIKIIENNLKYNIFDLLFLLENSKEVHLMQSSIKDLINSFEFPNTKIYLHNYVRGYGEELNSVGLNKIYKID
jgi:hypothetical protein